MKKLLFALIFLLTTQVFAQSNNYWILKNSVLLPAYSGWKVGTGSTAFGNGAYLDTVEFATKFPKNADTTTLRNQFLKNTDSTTERSYSDAKYSPIAGSASLTTFSGGTMKNGAGVDTVEFGAKYEPAWTTYKVAGADFTRTAQTLADITGLVTGTLAVSTLYEFMATLYCTTSAVATGVEFGVNVTGTASPTAQAIYMGSLTSTTGGISATTALTTADATAFLTTSSQSGVVVIEGTFQTGTGTPVFSIQGLKVTSGTLTVKIGSVLRVRAM